MERARVGEQGERVSVGEESGSLKKNTHELNAVSLPNDTKLCKGTGDRGTEGGGGGATTLVRTEATPVCTTDGAVLRKTVPSRRPHHLVLYVYTFNLRNKKRARVSREHWIIQMRETEKVVRSGQVQRTVPRADVCTNGNVNHFGHRYSSSSKKDDVARCPRPSVCASASASAFVYMCPCPCGTRLRLRSECAETGGTCVRTRVPRSHRAPLPLPGRAPHRVPGGAPGARLAVPPAAPVRVAAMLRSMCLAR